MFADFVAQNVLLFVALAVITLMLLYSYVGDRFLGYQQVSPEEATRLYNQGAIVVDVRSDAEFKTGYIGEARHISSSELKDKMSTLDHFKDKQILVYCQSGARSGGAASQLVKAGFSQVANLRGGVLAWKMAGLPLNQPVSKKARRKGKGAA
ncbi:rhodanese-like domain-containing protein [Thiomicrospira cyclica]|uniref:Rhodanese-like protein n=1 Tax=Thiomicrospira cyclica (strain DSM 14477 / JCM 11371 / ALM1) TaxID=717773 RepID=F6D9Z5_THICA|nr:rhodanese-like domain-containing protein [Thiomicrospira cyclica]AEG31032.1 Rhodanese-like protein [Thiomicrospira cyclica ALM1]